MHACIILQPFSLAKSKKLEDTVERLTNQLKGLKKSEKDKKEQLKFQQSHIIDYLAVIPYCHVVAMAFYAFMY